MKLWLCTFPHFFGHIQIKADSHFWVAVQFYRMFSDINKRYLCSTFARWAAFDGTREPSKKEGGERFRGQLWLFYLFIISSFNYKLYRIGLPDALKNPIWACSSAFIIKNVQKSAGVAGLLLMSSSEPVARSRGGGTTGNSIKGTGAWLEKKSATLSSNLILLDEFSCLIGISCMWILALLCWIQLRVSIPVKRESWDLNPLFCHCQPSSCKVIKV